MASAGPHKYAESELLKGLQDAAVVCGEPLTVTAYDAFRADHPELASGIWVIRHFGTWVTACTRAGLTANTTRSTSTRWTDEELVAFVGDYLKETPGGSYAGYQAWAREVDGAPSGPTLRSRMPWATAKRRAQTGTPD